MFTSLKNYLKIICVLCAGLLFVSCGGTIDYGQELVTTADGLPTWQDIENGAQLPPPPIVVSGAAPVFVTSPDTQVVEGELYSYAIEVADIDVGDKLVVRAERLPGWLELISDSTNQLRLTGTPDKSDVGTHSIVLKVVDLSGFATSQVFDLVVQAKPQVSPEPIQPPVGEYRVLVDTDIGHDPDDIQSLYRLAHYSDILKVEGIIASVSRNTEADIALLRQWIRTIRINVMRANGYPELMTQEALLANVRLGAKGLGGPGPGRASPGSNHIITSVQSAISKGDSRPLYILAWGPLTTVAQALHDSPEIAPYIRIYSIGSSNATADIASRNYIYNFMKSQYENLWWIENGSPLSNYRNTYIGIFFQGYQVGEWASQRFIDANIRGHGDAGDAFPTTVFSGLQEGDSPSMLYLLSPIVGGVGNVDIPTSESWGGQFIQYSSQTPNFYIDCCKTTTEAQATINKWRVKFLTDWKLRWDRYK